MRLIKSSIEHNGSGAVTLCPEEPEDMVYSSNPEAFKVNTNPNYFSGTPTTSSAQTTSSEPAQSAK
jgi:hypothetical protein